MINNNTLINLGIISMLAAAPHRASKQVVDGTLFQDARLSLESKLLGLISRNFDRVGLWKYLQKWDEGYNHKEGLYKTVGEWRTKVEAQHITSRSFERHIRPLYLHTTTKISGDPGTEFWWGCYLVNPNESEQMYLYYNLSPQMVIELSRELLNVRVWFLGQHEIFSSEPLGEVVEEVKRKYNKEV